MMKRAPRFLLFSLPLLAGLPARLSAQSLAVGASRWLTSPRISEYRIGVDGFWRGPVMFRPHAQLLRRGGESDAAWGGVGSDAIVRLRPDAKPYLLAGLGLGLGKADSLSGLGPALGLWGGLGAELATLGPLGLQAEALYAWRARVGVRSVSVGLRAGLRIGGPRNEGSRGTREGRAAPPTGSLPLPRANPADEDVIRRATGTPVAEAAPAPAASSAAAGVVAAALSAMGTPYRWGGSDENGFDCSGLIQYAYALQGIELPRRSDEQAKAGYEVERRLDRLLPGDILIFAGDPARTDRITHVGLYLGEGRFIHSATGGVQVSRLSPSDNAASWWFDRWVGVRRIAG
jgi:cell wall-associated NlpC family hydrolase